MATMTSSRAYLLIAVCMFALITVANSKSKHKPASTYFNICRRGDSNQLNECVKNTVMQMKTKLKKGISELGLVPLEPLVIPRLEMNQGSGSFALNTTLTNFTFHGLSNYEVKSANVLLDDEKFIFDLHMMTPQVNATANYEIDGQILVIPIKGKGNCEMTFIDLSTIAHTHGKVVTRGGQQFIELTHIKWDLSLNHDKSRSYFHNLFNGDKRLGDATNKFFNDNGAATWEAIRHLPEEAFGQVIRDLSAKVYDVYPISEIFPN